jgi:predicted NBD/HSP70 family sugar kinase
LRSANRQTIRRINEAAVLGAIHDHGPISRMDIAALTNLSPATITGITGKLIEQRLAREREATAPTGGPAPVGRPPVLVEIDRAAGCVVGVKLTEHHLVAALTDLGAETLARRSLPLGDDRSPRAVVRSLARVVAELRATEPTRRFFGVGIGLAGAIDHREGVCRFSPYLPWRDVPLRALLEPEVGRPVFVDNDVNALTLAERWFGGGAGYADFVVVTLGRGVGLGMVLDGRLYRGGHGAGGEFGHVTMEREGPRCDCGKRGCLEALVGEPAVTRTLAAACGPDVTLTRGAALARAGDTVARGVFEAAGATLGLALAGVVNVLNPTRVIVGGEGVHTLDLLLEPMRTALARHCFDGLYADLDLLVEPWDDNAWARGAAGLVLDEVLHARLDHRDDGEVGSVEARAEVGRHGR